MTSPASGSLTVMIRKEAFLGEPGSQIHHVPVDLAGDGVAGEARTDILGHIEDRGTGGKFPGAAVGQGNLDCLGHLALR